MIFKQEISTQNGRYTPLLCFHLGFLDNFWKKCQDMYICVISNDVFQFEYAT